MLYIYEPEISVLTNTKLYYFNNEDPHLIQDHILCLKTCIYMNYCESIEYSKHLNCNSKPHHFLPYTLYFKPHIITYKWERSCFDLTSNPIDYLQRFKTILFKWKRSWIDQLSLTTNLTYHLLFKWKRSCIDQLSLTTNLIYHLLFKWKRSCIDQLSLTINLTYHL